MAHETYMRIVPGAARAVLFLHGIVGTPNHFRDLIPLVPADTSVYALLLDGHGKGVREFSQTSMKKWLAQVDGAVEYLLQSHREVYIAAHSMGTLFAICQAVKRPEVKKLFLLAVPLKIFVRPSMTRHAVLVAFDRVKPEDEKAMAAKRACGVAPDKRLWRYIGWIPRYLELFRLIARVRKLLPQLTTPCQAYQSRHDEMVAQGAGKCLAKCKSVKLHSLPDSSHHYYAPEDYRFLLEEFRKFL